MKKNNYKRHFDETDNGDVYRDDTYEREDDGVYGDCDDTDTYGTASDYGCEDDYDEYGDDLSDYGDKSRMSEEASREYDALFGSGDKCRKTERTDPTVPGITYTKEGLPVYSGIYTGGTPDATLVHNDLCNAYARIREAGIKTLEELKGTDVFWDDRNVYNIYGRALRNAVRFMVASSKLKGLVLLQHKRDSLVDYDEACDYAVSKYLFRESFFNVVINSKYDPATTARITMSYVERTIVDCAKAHKVYNPDISELKRALGCDKEGKDYTAYPVHLDDHIGNDSDAPTIGESIPSAESEEDFKTVELLSCVESYTKLLSKRKVPKKQIDVFRLKAVTYLKHGTHVTPNVIAKELNVTLPTAYSLIKKVDLLYKDFAKYITA